MIESEVLDRYQITKSTLQTLLCRKKFKPFVDYYTTDINQYGFTPKGVDMLVDHFESEKMLSEWLRRLIMNMVPMDSICDRTRLDKEVVLNFIKSKFTHSRDRYIVSFYKVKTPYVRECSLKRKKALESAKNDVKTAIKNICGEDSKIIYYG